MDSLRSGNFDVVLPYLHQIDFLLFMATDLLFEVDGGRNEDTTKIRAINNIKFK